MRRASCVILAVALAACTEASITHRGEEPRAQVGGEISATKIGVFYLLWHCPTTNPVYVINQSWGPRGAFHWWGQPQLGNYCLSRDVSVLRQHAIWLRDAGVDFVFIDSTNHATTTGGQAREMIIEPFDRLLEEWSGIPGAPRIVPWAPLTAGSDMLPQLLQRLSRFPQLGFQLDGKQLALVVENGIDPARFAQLQAQSTLRVMWGLYGQPGPQWSFLEPCQAGFRESRGTAACKQRLALNGGAVEQVSITAAYQETYMSNTATAVPKFHGRTLRQQFQTLFDHPEARVATITGWNEWIAQRFCPDGTITCEPEAPSLFVDAWDEEYNRDLEPGGASGDLYYRLMRSCIGEFKRGTSCAGASSAGELCCQLAAQQPPGPPTPPAADAHDPVGVLDSVQGGFASGWACDQDDPSAQIPVHLYVGGPAGSGAPGYPVTANRDSEPAVNAICGGAAHRFQFAIPGWVAGQSVSVYGIDATPAGGHAELTGSPATIH